MLATNFGACKEKVPSLLRKALSSDYLILEDITADLGDQNENISQDEVLEDLCTAGRKAFRCKICGKLYTQKSSLTRHMTAHSGRKPYSCTVCGKKFTRKDSCSDHIRVHRFNMAVYKKI